MIKNPLIMQIVVGIITLILFSLGMHFRNKIEDSEADKKKIFNILFITLMIATAIGTIYFIANIVTNSTLTFGNAILAMAKFVIFLLIGFNIFAYMDGETIIDIEFQGIFFVISLFISLFVIIIPMLICSEVYESKVEEVEGQRYIEEEFELVSIFNSKEIEGAVNNIVSTNDYYNTIIEKVVEENEEKEKIVGYEICYVDNETKEKIYIKLNAENTSIIPIENNKKAYLLEKTYTSYSIDHNQDPPVECRFEEELKYELHVPMEIEEVSTTN